MNILEYKGKVKNFKKSELQIKLDSLLVGARDLSSNIERMEANKIDLSSYINQWVVTKSVVKALEAAGYRGVGYVHMTKAALKVIEALIPMLSKVVRDQREEIWSGRTMNLRQVNLLNLLEHIEHWLRYTTLVYDVLLTLNNQGTNQPEALVAKGDAKWVNGTLEFYKNMSVTLLKGAMAINKALEAIPQVDVSEGSLAVLEATEGKDSVDLNKQGFGIHHVNPIYWYDLGVMNLNVARIEKMRRQNELFAMKINQAANKKNGVNDAALDEEIEIYQDEIIKNVNTIEEIERKYA